MATRNIFIFDSTVNKEKKKKEHKEFKATKYKNKTEEKILKLTREKISTCKHVHTNASGLTAAFTSEMTMEIGKEWSSTLNMYKQPDQICTYTLYIPKTPPKSK